MELANKIAIQELLAKYTHFIDYKMLDRMHEIWTPNCRFIADTPLLDLNGLETLLEMFEQTNQTLPTIRHVISNIYIEGNDHTAFIHAYVQAVDFDTKAIVAGGRYKDMVINTHKGWRIQERHYTAG